MPHTEIAAWGANNNVSFEGPEAQWLYKMSDAYASEYARASGKDVTAPYEHKEPDKDTP